MPAPGDKETGKIRCDQCNYKATSSTSLLAHLDAKHTTRKYKCDECGMTADDQDKLNKHTRSCHTKRDKKMVFDNNKAVCTFWLEGRCFYDAASCRFKHLTPPKCRFGNSCRAWPYCDFSHENVDCKFQEYCLNQNCPYTHNFLVSGSSPPAPDIRSHKEFPQFKPKMWRPWF